jgi:hypothetical protein
LDNDSIIEEDVTEGPIYTVNNIDLDSLPPNDTLAKMINSPRSIEAFNRSGIRPEELHAVDVNAIH